MEAKSLDELLNSALNDVEKGFKSQVQETYEKPELHPEARWTGKVIDNEDPDKLGRVKILVFGYYDEIPSKALPWAVPDIGYVGGTNGSFIIPEVGTMVRGYFDQGDIQKPIYDSVAFSEMTARNLQKNQTLFKFEDYPNKMVFFETDQGDYLTLNRSNGETEFKHRTGLSITVGLDGSLTINTGSFGQPGNITINTDGKTEVNAMQDITVTSKMGNVLIDGTVGMVQLGRNPAKQFVNNLPVCPVTGMPHYVGNTNVQC